MGRDKGLLPFHEGTLIQRVLERVAPIADETLVTTNNPESYRFLELPLYADVYPDRGALGGLYTAINAAAHPLVAVVACDMPFINADLLNYQRELLISTHSDVVIPHTGGGLEPFHSVYRRSTCLPAIEAALQDDKWRVDAWFSRVEIQQLEPEGIKIYDPEMRSFFNINTPDDLQIALRIASD
jgi:molybdopterin-guanine dinucleotide biosynthesis protein A